MTERTEATTARPARVVDAHVHLWDPARTDWYPYLSGRQQLDLGDVTGMSRRFDVPTYQAEAAGWNVEKLVNVAAATGRNSIEETLELDGLADTDAEAAGHPDAIVGGLPPTASTAEAEALLDRQMAASRFRGVRPMGAFDGPLPGPDVLASIRDRGLLFELMAHPDQLVPAAKGLAAFDDLTVVVEHTGWPRSADEEERALWDDGMTALAGLGERVVCKLSGLAMPLGSMAPGVFAPWLERAIEMFGVDRCLFASNFPVDGMHGTLDELFTTYSTVTAGLDEASRDNLFAANAERVYRC
jgi:L-fuconolactonase